MPSIEALTLTPALQAWLEGTRQPRVLHVFDRACNLVNERREVLSVVTAQVGNGPFNLVIGDEVIFSRLVDLESPISIRPSALSLGVLTIHTAPARLWQPRPDWESLHAQRDRVVRRLLWLPVFHLQPGPERALASDLAAAVAAQEAASCSAAASRLAGLGRGLTPSGDDLLMGAIHSAWLLHPPDSAARLSACMAQAAAPRTTSLSAAWLGAAAFGQAGEVWHDLFQALLAGDPAAQRSAVRRLLSTGHTSGADALAGFAGVLKSHANQEMPHVLSAQAV